MTYAELEVVMHGTLGTSQKQAFLSDLNAAVRIVPGMPRVRFDCEVGADAEAWLKRKHANGAVHEPATLAAFVALSQRFAFRNIFDVGALFGYFSLFCSALFEDAQVTAFELLPGAMKPLWRNVYPTVTCVHAAVSDVGLEAQRVWVSGFNIFEEPEGGWESLPNVPGAMKKRGENGRGRGFVTVDFITLDTYCAHAGPPDLIKIDVEAYQAKALRGAHKTIRQHKPVIVIELHDLEKVERMGMSNRDTIQPVLDAGYLGFWCGNHRSIDATFECVTEMGPEHERLSLMVLLPEERLTI